MLMRFLSRHAGIVAALSGILAYSLILPEDAPWWQALGVGLAVLVPVYLLLFRYGVTRIGRSKR